MNPIELIAQPLTRQAFEPFGDVIEVSDTRRHYTINSGATERYDALAVADAQGEGSRVVISIFRSLHAAVLPIPILSLERHPLGSQAFVPMAGTPFLVVVAPPGDQVDAREVRAFYSNGHQGVNYRRGAWHHSLLALQAGQDFLVVDRAGPDKNCDAVVLAESVTLIGCP